MRSNASHPSGPHDWLVNKAVNRGPHYWGREVLEQFAQLFVTAVTATPLVSCVVWCHVALVISSFIVDSRGEAGSCLRRSSRSSIMAKISAGTCSV